MRVDAGCEPPRPLSVGPGDEPVATFGGMADVPEIRTERLLMREFRDDDREPFAALNADPVVMEHFQRPLDRADSDAFVDRIHTCWVERRWGLWAVEVPDQVPFIGYVGLWPAPYVSERTVEVGWRLAKESWGQGYAPEAARAAMAFGFEKVALDEIVSFTVPQNRNSWRVMEKIGLLRRPSRDFEHPNVDQVAHPELCHHVFYALTAAEWQTEQGRSPDSPGK